MLDIRGENIKLWKNERKGKDGTPFYTYSISISSKDMDGKWINKQVKLRFPKSVHVPDDLANGAMIDFAGFPTLDVYTGKDGNEHREVMIVAQNVRFIDYDYGDSFAQAGDDIPF